MHKDELLHKAIQEGGAIYVAGNIKMCQAIKEVIQEYVIELVGDGEKGMKFLKRQKSLDLFCVKAW